MDAKISPMLPARGRSAVALLLLSLPSCSLLIDTNPDGVIRHGSAGSGTTQSATSVAGSSTGGAGITGGAASNGAGAPGVAGAQASGGVDIASDVNPSAQAGAATSLSTAAAGATSTIGGTAGATSASGGTAQECTIGSAVYAKAAGNPSNPCQSCDPSKSTTDWSPGPDGKTCGSNQLCHEGTCSNGCWINSKYYAVGASNPGDSCMYCQSSSPNGWVLANPCVTRIFAGASTSCEIKATGSGLWCWGAAVGDGTDTNRPTPTLVDQLGYSRVIQVSSACTHSCAITDSNEMWCWGYDDYGAFGTGQPSSYTPLKSIPTGVLEVAASCYVNCILVGNEAQCSGGGEGLMNLGNAGTEGTGKFGAISGLGQVTTLASGGGHFCAVSDGSVWCWGDGYSTFEHRDPVRVQNLSRVSRLSVGSGHACATVGGDAFCWGNNTTGQLGNNSATESRNPVKVIGIDAPVAQLTGGYAHTCAIAAGKLYCWGANDYGQLGDGTKDTHLVATPVPGFSIGVTDVAAGGGHTCAIKNGVAYCWGSNRAGQLGTGATNGTVDDYSLVPVPVFVQR